MNAFVLNNNNNNNTKKESNKETEFKVLIYDKRCRDILSPLIKVYYNCTIICSYLFIYLFMCV